MACRLCKVGDLPGHLQFNKDIQSGYRRPMSGGDCVRSWWAYVHNESFNCYSHGAALVFFIFYARYYHQIWPTGYSASPVVLFFIVSDFVYSTLPFLLSVCYHTFMPHSSGQPVYRQLLKTDIFGVWWICTFGPLSSFYTGLYCCENLLFLYLAAYFTLSAIVLYYLMIEDCKRKRVAALTAQSILRFLIHPVRLSSWSPSSSSTAVFYYIAMDVVTSIGALINGFHIPERWMKGRLSDYFLNGHSLMHILAIVGVLIGKYGFFSDVMWLNNASCDATL